MEIAKITTNIDGKYLLYLNGELVSTQGTLRKATEKLYKIAKSQS